MWADDRNILKTLNIGDVKQLHASSADSFQILMKLNENAYAINLFINVGISFTFNVEYLVDYKGLDVIPLVDEPFHELIFESPFLSLLPDILLYTACQVNKFLDNKIITT